MKKIILFLLAAVQLSASIDSPVAHVEKMAAAQTNGDHGELFSLYEEAVGVEKFKELLNKNGGEQAFRELIEEYFTPYDEESLWVVNSVEKLAEYRPEQAEMLSFYREVKEGYMIVFVGDSEKLSYYFFKRAGDKWRMVEPGDYMPLPHNQ